MLECWNDTTLSVNGAHIPTFRHSNIRCRAKARHQLRRFPSAEGRQRSAALARRQMGGVYRVDAVAAGQPQRATCLGGRSGDGQVATAHRRAGLGPPTALVARWKDARVHLDARSRRPGVAPADRGRRRPEDLEPRRRRLGSGLAARWIGTAGRQRHQVDGKDILVAMHGDSTVADNTNVDIYAVDGPVLRQITTNTGADNTPRYSPDNHWAAYLSMERAGFEADRVRLMIADRRAGVPTPV